MKWSPEKSISWFRELARKFSEFTDYDGYEIVQVEIEKVHSQVRTTGKKHSIEDKYLQEDYVKEIKKRKDFAILEGLENGKKMTMKLLRPHGDKKIGLKRENSLLVHSGKWKWSEEEIQDFLQEVGDTNSIHQGENAIVPGLLMIETMLASMMSHHIFWNQIKVRFYQPVFVDEPVVAEEEKYFIQIRGKDGRICWKMWFL